MNITNFEFKAKVKSTHEYEKKLQQLNPVFKGTDNQTDTYFNVNKGRLKLREGNIENALINYERENIAGSKSSSVILYKHNPDKALKDILVYQFGVKTIVNKTRKIYFIENVKFHFDEVKNLGAFIEVEAIDNNGNFSATELREQCNKYFVFFELKQEDMIDKSYSDLLLAE